MSLTKIGLVFAAFMYTILLYNAIDEDRIINTNQQRIRYTEIVDNTLTDTTYTMLSTMKYENDVMRLDISKCLSTFKKTLTVNLNIENNDIYYTEFMNHVPLILFIDGDGLYSYALTNTGSMLEHVLHEKRYFSYFDNVNNLIVHFTFSDYYELYDTTYDLAYRGTYAEIKALGIANNVFGFSEEKVLEMRNQIITEHINNELLRINEHNNYAKSIGVGYKFFIPGDDTTFGKTINSPGIVTFIQGISLGKKSLNITKFSAATIKEAELIEGYDNLGKLIYYEASNPNKVGTYIETFSTKKEAAQAGYYPSN